MKRYRKAVAAVIGVAALVAMRYFDVQVPGIDAVVMDLVVGALVSFGVYAVPNQVP